MVIFSHDFLLHRDPAGIHPERPERLIIAIKSVKEDKSLQGLIELQELPQADYSIPYLVHSSEYVEYIKSESSKGFHYIDFDTYVNEFTFDVATKALTASYLAGELSLNTSSHVLVLPRPPGHHVGRNGKAMKALSNGFCIFNNSAAAVKFFTERGFKVLVVDFDAHHGNGTQEIFWYDDAVVHIDIHESGIFPGTGNIHDIGGEGAEGTKINIPLPPLSSDVVYVWIASKLVPSIVKAFKPSALVISAGFDAHVKDPLTTLNVEGDAYIAFGALVRSLLQHRLIRGAVTVLEGGYGEGLRRGLPLYIQAVSLGLREELKPVSNKELYAKYGKLLRNINEVIGRYWGIDFLGQHS